MYQSEASTVLYSGASPWSTKRLGSIPSDTAGPFEQDRARVVEPAGRQAQTPQRDERVAAPVGEPGIAGDDGLPEPRLDEIGVGRALQREPKRAPPCRAPRGAGGRGPRSRRRGQGSGGARTGRRRRGEIPAEDPGRGEILPKSSPRPAPPRTGSCGTTPGSCVYGPLERVDAGNALVGRQPTRRLRRARSGTPGCVVQRVKSRPERKGRTRARRCARRRGAASEAPPAEPMGHEELCSIRVPSRRQKTQVGQGSALNDSTTAPFSGAITSGAYRCRVRNCRRPGPGAPGSTHASSPFTSTIRPVGGVVAVSSSA